MRKTEIELKLVNMTINPEGAENGNGALGSSLRFDGDLLIDKLVPMYSTSKIFSSWIDVMWDQETGDLLGPEFGKLPMTTSLEKVGAVLAGPVSGEIFAELSDCKLNSVELEPKNGRRVGITLKLYVHPTDSEWESLMGVLRREVKLTLTGGRDIEKREKSEKNKNRSLPLGNPEAGNGEQKPPQDEPEQTSPTVN